MTKQQIEIDQTIHHMAEEQVLFLKNRYKMNPKEIIQMYGGNAMGNETYLDAVERIAVFNIQTTSKNGFLVS